MEENEFLDYFNTCNLIENWRDNLINWKMIVEYIENHYESLLTCANIQDIRINHKNPEKISNEISLKYKGIESLYLIPKGKILKKFIDIIDEEVKRVYLFYLSLEREVYSKINFFIHRQNFILNELNNEKLILETFDQLKFLTLFNFEIAKFVDVNITWLKLILDRFNNSFEHIFGPIDKKYFYEKTSVKNSDLSYFISFKIIDETSIIIENLSKEIFRKILKIKEKKDLNQVESLNESLNDNNHVFENIQRKYNEIINFGRISDDFSIGFFKKLNLWDIFSKESHDKMEKELNLDGSVNKILTDKSFLLSKFNFLRSYSSRNRINIILALIHAFLYSTLYFVDFGLGADFMIKIGRSEFLFGLIISTNIISEYFAVFIDRLLMKKSSYKICFLISIILLILNRILFLVSFNAKSLFLLFLSRIVLGLGSAKFLNKQYINLFTDEIDKKRLIDYLSICSVFGSSMGFLISYLVNFFKITRINGTLILSKFTLSSIILFFVLLMYLIVCIKFYSDPLGKYFRIFEDEINDSLDLESQHSRKITIEEDTMIKEINGRLEDFNQKSNYSDSNVVSSKLKEIIRNERTVQCSYINKTIWISLVFVSISEVILQSVFISSNYYFPFQIKNDNGLVCLITFLTLLLITFILFLNTRYFEYKLDKQYLILIYSTCIFLGSFFLSNHFYDSQIQYSFGLLTILTSILLLETYYFELILKVIPKDDDIKSKKYYSYLRLFPYLGKFIGTFILLMFSWISNKYAFKIFGGYLIVISFSLFILSLVFYKTLRIKPVARLTFN